MVGHVLRRPIDALIRKCKTMLTKSVKRRRDRPEITWRNNFIIINADLDKDKAQWRKNIPIGDIY